MYIHELKQYKKITGIIVLISGIILIITSIIAGKYIALDIREIGLIQFKTHTGFRNNILFTIFNAGFPMGMGISIVGAAILSDASRKRIWWYAWLILLAAVVISIIPVVFDRTYSDNYFFIGGVLITILFLLFTWFWSRNRHKLDLKSQIAADLKMAGYFFFLLAAWQSFSLFGFPFYSLNPEKIISKPDTLREISHAKLIVTLFILGWIFTVIGYHYNNRINIQIRKKIKFLSFND